MWPHLWTRRVGCDGADSSERPTRAKRFTASTPQGQEAFLEGHVEAFAEIGGVPTRHIRYVNLSSAVSLVIYGHGVRDRVENERWQLFRSHYGFDAFYCQPGIAVAHEKGGVEGEVGRFRRNRLTPMPKVDSLAELNEQIRVWDEIDNTRRIDSRIRTVGEDFAVEQPLLAPLPGDYFDPGIMLHPRVDRSALITVRMTRYSVPAHLIGQRVRVSLRAFDLTVRDDKHRIVARHPRVVDRCAHCLELDHYLEVPAHKPGALPGSTALAQARAAGTFTAAHEAFWAAARKTEGDTAGTPRTDRRPAAAPDDATCRCGWLSYCSLSAMTATADQSSAGSRAQGFVGRSGWPTSISTPTPTSTQPPSTPSLPATGCAPATHCV